MSQTTVSATPIGAYAMSYPRWNAKDTIWMLSLYGTAIGAGTLFLPINAGMGGFWPLLVMALLAFPLTFFSHQGLTRFVLSGSSRDGDITKVVEEHFGQKAGKLITLLYFFAIFPILLVYSVAITNTVASFLTNQLHITPPPRMMLSGMLILGLMLLVRSGKDRVVKAMSVLVFPFIAVLMVLAVYLIPHWNGAIFSQSGSIGSALNDSFPKTLWLAIPVMVFSFNHSPIISSFAVSQKVAYGADAEKKSSRILMYSHFLMVITVMFFVFSCVFSLSQADLAAAKEQNISILSYLANHFNTPIIAYLAPLIAFVAITKSFLGHYLGASEGLIGLVEKQFFSGTRNIPYVRIERVTSLAMGLTAWWVATLNPSILGMIESLGGPVIALILFIMPMYAIYKIPAMHRYAGKVSNIFVMLVGSIAISAIFYNLFC